MGPAHGQGELGALGSRSGGPQTWPALAACSQGDGARGPRRVVGPIVGERRKEVKD